MGKLFGIERKSGHLQNGYTSFCMRIAWLLFFVAYMTSLLPAQSQQVDSVFIEKIVQGFEARLEQPGGDTASLYIKEFV